MKKRLPDQNIGFHELIVLGGGSMDKYTKFVLSVIAISLIAIVIKLWEPRPVYSGFMEKGPTVGDFMNLRKLKGANLRKEKGRIIKSIPIVDVYGTVGVAVENTVDVSGSVDCN